MRTEADLLLRNLVANVINYFKTETFNGARLIELKAILDQIKQTYTPTFFPTALFNNSTIVAKIEDLKNSLTVDGNANLNQLYKFIDKEGFEIGAVANELVVTLFSNNEVQRLEAKVLLAADNNRRSFVMALRATAIKLGVIKLDIKFGRFDESSDEDEPPTLAIAPPPRQEQLSPSKIRFGNFSDSDDANASSDENNQTEDQRDQEEDELDALIQEADAVRAADNYDQDSRSTDRLTFSPLLQTQIERNPNPLHPLISVGGLYFDKGVPTFPSFPLSSFINMGQSAKNGLSGLLTDLIPPDVVAVYGTNTENAAKTGDDLTDSEIRAIVADFRMS